MAMRYQFIIYLLLIVLLSSCSALHHNSKYNFNDGIYYSDILARHPVYVYKVDDDTIMTFAVKQFPDSTAILTQHKTVYASYQKRLKDNKTKHTFYQPSLDVDVMTIPLKYRPTVEGIPNQLTTNFNGALFCGYRVDQYTLSYDRTPLNTYKQDIKHLGYSAGIFAGIGSTEITDWQLHHAAGFDYQGVTLITGICFNVAMQSVDFGLSLGFDHLLDKYHQEWVYQGKPCVGFTLGINLN